MTPLKAKRLRHLISNLRDLAAFEADQDKYPLLAKIAKQAKSAAFELEILVTAGTNPPHPKPSDRVLTADIRNKDLSDMLKEVTGKLGDKVALVGGLAVIHWVDIRETLDLDFVVLASDMDAVKAAFPGGETKALIYSVNVNGMDLDFLIQSEFPWTQEAIRHSVKEKVLGVQTQIITPEYLILYKFRAARERDMSDIESLLTLKGIPKKARALVEKYLPEDLEDFNSLATLAEYNLR
jgi:hypothetical protein